MTPTPNLIPQERLQQEQQTATQDVQVPLEHIGWSVQQDYASELKAKIAALTHWRHDSFPGSQPVSFEKKHLECLEQEDYFVCEKSDGVRYLMFLVVAPKGPAAFLIDRKYNVRYVDVQIPLPGRSAGFHNETLLDGELVNQIDGDKKSLRFIAFDLIAINGVSLVQRSFSTRIGYLRHDVIKQYEQYYSANPALNAKIPFSIGMKEQQRSYGMKLVFEQLLTLKHENDGLIFTPVRVPYVPGTCEKLLKWKPPDQNTVDFKIKVIFNKDRKPQYRLHICQSGLHVPNDYLTPEPELIEKWRQSSPDGKIGEFKWDPEWETIAYDEGYAAEPRKGGWRFVRFREDKEQANDETVLVKIKQSIEDGVTREMLESRVDAMRAHWKEREQKQSGTPAQNPGHPLSKTTEGQSPTMHTGLPTPALETSPHNPNGTDYGLDYESRRRISTHSSTTDLYDRRTSYDFERRQSVDEVPPTPRVAFNDQNGFMGASEPPRKDSADLVDKKPSDLVDKKPNGSPKQRKESLPLVPSPLASRTALVIPNTDEPMRASPTPGIEAEKEEEKEKAPSPARTSPVKVHPGEENPPEERKRSIDKGKQPIRSLADIPKEEKDETKLQAMKEEEKEEEMDLDGDGDTRQEEVAVLDSGFSVPVASAQKMDVDETKDLRLDVKDFPTRTASPAEPGPSATPPSEGVSDSPLKKPRKTPVKRTKKEPLTPKKVVEETSSTTNKPVAAKPPAKRGRKKKIVDSASASPAASGTTTPAGTGGGTNTPKDSLQLPPQPPLFQMRKPPRKANADDIYDDDSETDSPADGNSLGQSGAGLYPPNLNPNVNAKEHRRTPSASSFRMQQDSPSRRGSKADVSPSLRASPSFRPLQPHPTSQPTHPTSYHSVLAPSPSSSGGQMHPGGRHGPTYEEQRHLMNMQQAFRSSQSGPQMYQSVVPPGPLGGQAPAGYGRDQYQSVLSNHSYMYPQPPSRGGGNNPGMNQQFNVYPPVTHPAHYNPPNAGAGAQGPSGSRPFYEYPGYPGRPYSYDRYGGAGPSNPGPTAGPYYAIQSSPSSRRGSLNVTSGDAVIKVSEEGGEDEEGSYVPSKRGNAWLDLVLNSEEGPKVKVRKD